MMTTPIAHEITPREPHNGYLVMQGGLPRPRSGSGGTGSRGPRRRRPGAPPRGLDSERVEGVQEDRRLALLRQGRPRPRRPPRSRRRPSGRPEDEVRPDPCLRRERHSRSSCTTPVRTPSASSKCSASARGRTPGRRSSGRTRSRPTRSPSLHRGGPLLGPPVEIEGHRDGVARLHDRHHVEEAPRVASFPLLSGPYIPFTVSESAGSGRASRRPPGSSRSCRPSRAQPFTRRRFAETFRRRRTPLSARVGGGLG